MDFNITLSSDDIKRPDLGMIWKSHLYRRWIRDNKECLVCKKELVNEKESFITHHHLHSGGKNPRDQLLVPLCLFCHNHFHSNEPLFYQTHNLNSQKLDLIALFTLIEFLSYKEDRFEWALINKLVHIAKGVK